MATFATYDLCSLKIRCYNKIKKP